MLTRLAKAAIFVLFLAAGIAGLLLGNPAQKMRATMDEACHTECANHLKLHRLVPALPPGSLDGGKHDGAWKCECY